MTPAIDVINVSKVYRRYARKKQFATLKSAILDGSLLGDLKPDETFQALKNVSFQVPKGCTYGVIGSNGSGKSTLLKCVAGITRPTQGDVKVDGRISALIELGAGFHPEISGRENIFINGIMLGLTKKEIQYRFDEIVEFSEIEKFLDTPVKHYSSGMYMRLAFSIAAHPPRTIRSASETFFPFAAFRLKSCWICSNFCKTLASCSGSLTAQSFCGAKRIRAPLAPPRLSDPRKVEAEAQAVATNRGMDRPDAMILLLSPAISCSLSNGCSTAGTGSCHNWGLATKGPRHRETGPISRCVSLYHALAKATSNSFGFS